MSARSVPKGVPDAVQPLLVQCTEEGREIGRTLMGAARNHTAAAECRRLWLVTTNDNTRAFRFYQLWGMDLCAFYRYGAHRSRQVKPELPERGADGLPLDHELEFELLLGGTFRSGVPLREGTQSRPESSESAGSETA